MSLIKQKYLLNLFISDDELQSGNRSVPTEGRQRKAPVCKKCGNPRKGHKKSICPDTVPNGILHFLSAQGDWGSWKFQGRGDFKDPGNSKMGDVKDIGNSKGGGVLSSPSYFIHQDRDTQHLTFSGATRQQLGRPHYGGALGKEQIYAKNNFQNFTIKFKLYTHSVY